MSKGITNIYDEHLKPSDERVRNLALICLATLTIGIIISFLKYNLFNEVKITWELLHVYHTAFSIALLIGMAGLYYHASRFYRDSFYLFISIAWLLNLAYLLFLQGSPSNGNPEHLNFRSFSMLLALLSDLPFYLAGRTKLDEQPNYKDLIFPFVAISLWVVIYIYPFDPLTKSSIHTILAITFATYVAFKVYTSSRLRALTINLENTDNPDISDEKQSPSKFPKILLSYTFLALAVIQLTFVFILSENTRPFVNYILYLALLLKILNAYALTIMLREDYADIRARAERNEQRLQQERQERSEFEEIGLLTASIEHELRTPLGVINSKLNDMSRKHQHLEDVVADVNYLQIQRERLLNATKVIKVLRAGHEFFNKRLTTVDLGHLTRKAVRDVKKELKTDEVGFKYESTLNRPLAIAHPQLLEQAVINILKNAVESIRANHSSNGLIEIKITKSRVLNEFLVMDFKDNGVGLPEESLDRLTQPDFSTKGAERPNSGLGLFVCERIIKLHNGTLEFKSPEEGGAIVSISIPRAIPKKEAKRQRDDARDSNAHLMEAL